MGHDATPPTPDGVPLLGNGLAFSRDPFGAMESWARHGDVVRLEFPGRSMYLVTGPELIEEVLLDSEGRFTIGREQRETFSGIEDDALTANTGDRWRRHRGALQPAFTWDGIEGYGGRMTERTAEHVAGWADGERLDLHHQMRLLTLHVLGDTLLGIDVEGDEAVAMDAADALVARADPRRFGRLLPGWLPTPTERRFERRVAELDAYVAGVLAARSSGDGDVCSVLPAARDRGDLSMAEVRDTLVGLLLAGHDTSAVALTYAWYELSRRPRVRESLASEGEAVADDGPPRSEHFDDLERTRHVASETLRLYPRRGRATGRRWSR
ncbi:cytochrome P450 [Halomicrococcus gelatinilyticus]|uniref:cytochrome P450 n=1 Tax=Halomicrococcus gelatinilyticus TaxID=1702103 RepID=UPI002E0F4624